MPTLHARLSPSSAHRWTSCTASAAAQDGIPNENSDASREGTCCHQIQAECLSDPTLDPQSYLGRDMLFWRNGELSGEDWGNSLTEGHLTITGSVTVTQDMIDAVVTAVNLVRERVSLLGAELEVEQRVPIGHFTGEPDAFGTADVVYITKDTIGTIDSKFGRHKVDAFEVITPAHTDPITGIAVPAVTRANLQLACYVLGAYEKFGLMYDFQHVTMSIVQPFIGHVSDYSCSIEELLGIRNFLQAKAEETRSAPRFEPTPDNCHFCRASGNCEAQTEAVLASTLAGFTDEGEPQPKPLDGKTPLGSLYALLPLIGDWCKAVDQRVRDNLAQGIPVLRADGVAYKLVQGKKAARQWADAAEAEAAMKAMRLKPAQMYVSSLVSPTAAEKLAKVPKAKKGETPAAPVLGPTRWKRLQALIAPQGTTAPVVALESDPRPAVAPATEGFEDVPPADNSDLF